MGTIILSAIVAHTSWHWMMDRGAQLMLYQFTWPALTPAFLAGALRLAMLLVGIAAIAWLVSVVRGRRADARQQKPDVETQQSGA
jgi:hypothetical protein